MFENPRKFFVQDVLESYKEYCVMTPISQGLFKLEQAPGFDAL